MREVGMWLLPERKEDLSVMCGPERRFAESLQVGTAMVGTLSFASERQKTGAWSMASLADRVVLSGWLMVFSHCFGRLLLCLHIVKAEDAGKIRQTNEKFLEPDRRANRTRR